MVRFIIVRHGLTTFNKEHRYQGQYEAPLDEIGIRQAEITAEHIAGTYHVDAIYASDLQRTVNTAKKSADLLGLPINTSKALREIHVGAWEGRLVKEVWAENPERVDAYRNDPGTFHFEGGECFREVYDRASAFLDEIAKKHDGENVLIVSHGGVIRSLICVWSGVPLRDLKTITVLPNTSITVAEYEGGSVRLPLVGDNSHLPEELRT